jgi:orotidine-5'-phosphate decarboxylase
MISVRNPIMLALDVDSDQQAFSILDQVGDLVGAVKIGPRLNLKYGASFVEKASKYAPIFVDNKYFDITSTVLASVQASFDSGATFATVHALNGYETLKELAILEKKLNGVRPFKVLAVTILTSWSQENFPANFKSLSVQDHVVSLAQMVLKSGL